MMGGWKLKYSKLLLWLQLVLPWLSTPLLGKKSFKQFLPVAIFISLFIHYESKLAKKRKWWWYYEKIHPKVPGGFTLTWGTFLVHSLCKSTSQKIMEFTKPSPRV
jgi:hypothetical protein